MDAVTAQAEVQRVWAAHGAKRGEFEVPSAVHAGHMLIVRRLGSALRPVTKDDLHRLMHAPVPPGHGAVFECPPSQTPKQFAVYMSLHPTNPVAAAVAPPQRNERPRSIG